MDNTASHTRWSSPRNLDQILQLLPHYKLAGHSSPFLSSENVETLFDTTCSSNSEWEVASTLLSMEASERAPTQFVNHMLSPWLNNDNSINTPQVLQVYIAIVNGDVTQHDIPFTTLISTMLRVIFIVQAQNAGYAIVVAQPSQHKSTPDHQQANAYSGGYEEGNSRFQTLIPSQPSKHVSTSSYQQASAYSSGYEKENSKLSSTATSQPSKYKSPSRHGDINVYFSGYEEDNSDLRTSITALLTLAAQAKSGALSSVKWRHYYHHEQAFLNNIPSAIHYAIALSTRTIDSQISLSSILQACSDRLLQIVTRGAGERSTDLSLGLLFQEVNAQFSEHTSKQRKLQNSETMEAEDTNASISARAKKQRTCTIRLTDGSSPPAVIIVARSSQYDAPKEWFCGKDTLEEGLKIWALAYLKEYHEIYADMRPACIIARSGVRTVDTPAIGDQITASDAWDRTRLLCVVEHTTALRNAMQASTSKPTIISIGVDGWGCNVARIADFIKIKREFHFVFRTQSI